MAEIAGEVRPVLVEVVNMKVMLDDHGRHVTLLDAYATAPRRRGSMALLGRQSGNGRKPAAARFHRNPKVPHRRASG
ncbi:MAG: hypothetical protein OXU77_14360 [Gammaproteobacteria bacterium]|nr:hypothetical protein [Gammaproteobacteria bacterium]